MLLLEQDKIKIILNLDNSELNTLLKANEFCNYTSSMFNYGEEVENCQNIRSQIMQCIK